MLKYKMQTAYILINGAGILLGVYRDKLKADIAMTRFNNETDTNNPGLFLYKVHSDQVDKHAANVFEMIRQEFSF